MMQVEDPGYVKTKEDVPFEKGPGGFCNKGFFDHGLGIGKMQLKNMPSGFNVYPESKTVNGRQAIGLRHSVALQELEVFRIYGNPPG